MLGPARSVGCTGRACTGHLHRSPLVLRAIHCPLVLFRSPCCEAAGPAPCTPQHGCVLLWGLQSFSCPVSQRIGLMPCTDCGSPQVPNFSTHTLIPQKSGGCSHGSAASHFSPSRDSSENTDLSSPFSLCSLQLVSVKSVFPCSFWALTVLGLLALVDLLRSGGVNAPCCSSADEQYILLTTPVKCPFCLNSPFVVDVWLCWLHRLSALTS